MAESFPIPAYFIVIIFLTRLKSIIAGKSKSSRSLFRPKLLSYKMENKLRDDPETIHMAATDYGNIVKEAPAAVLCPSSINDIKSLIKLSYSSSECVPFQIAARGQGHSVRGQAMARNGVVIDMKSLNRHRNGSGGVVVGKNSFHGCYADVGGEQLWIDVLNTTLKYGLSPISWTDYLHITVGGTLSNAGIGGQTFRHGPQISNVHEMDVITGKGDLVTCSSNRNEELFNGVLGGLGQFGIIVRARIALEPAPTRVKWVRMLYTSFSAFTRDQERLISVNGKNKKNGVNYLEGLLLMHNGPPNNWRSSFFPPSDHPRIISLVQHHRLIYCIEVAKYYDDQTQTTVDEELEMLFEGLEFIPGFVFKKDVSYVNFLDRVQDGETKLQAQGLWDVPHPWLNLFVPKSTISEFNQAVFRDIVLRRNITTGPVLVYPMNRSKWDERMSAVTVDEDVFYAVGFLHSSGFDNWKEFDEQNREILEFCANSGIKVKQYLPHYNTKEDWLNHFGSKWRRFEERKYQFDPKLLLSPGQRIFKSFFNGQY